MKKTLTIAALVALALLGFGVAGAFFATRLGPDPNALAVGAAAPVTSFTTHSGQPLSLDPAQGLPVLVFYRGHW